jgi:fructokinase
MSGPVGYAAILGEALVDLLDSTVEGEHVYRPAIGGGPLNVAVGVTRLGGAAQFVGSLSDDVWGDRISAFLTDTGVGTQGVRRVPAPSSLAVTTHTGAEPEFRFYGTPPSYALLQPGDLDLPLLHGAAVLYAGSISLLSEPFLDTARKAWAVPGPMKVFDPNVRPALVPDRPALAGLRDLVEQFAATADLVKLSEADGRLLYDGAPVSETADRLRAAGAAVVVVTRGPHGAVVVTDAGTVAVPAPVVTAVDATGAGDSVMAALIAHLLADGPGTGPAGWADAVTFALTVAALVCERPGGAAAMPTRDEVAARWGAVVSGPPVVLQ